MAAHDRQRWDTIYRERANDPIPDPDPLLFQYTPPVPSDSERRALDLACGFAQNGLWLASQGYVVDVMDISRVALTRAQEEMAKRGLRNMNVLQMDLDEVSLPDTHYDVLCVFRYLRRDLFPYLRASVRPGGRIIYETFNLNYLEAVPAFNPDFLLEPGELAGYFADWRILYNAEPRYVSQFVAVKPRL